MLSQHSYDNGVSLGGIDALRELAEGVDAVVSLCRVGDEDVPSGIPHVEVRLIDGEKADDNPNLDYVLSYAANVVGQPVKKDEPS